MKKITVDPKSAFYPKPAFLVGANVNGKPNFMVVVSGGGACVEPPMMSVSLNLQRYTLEGIRRNMTFSINLPPADMMKEYDYCGLQSGASADKVEVCKFKVFYGKLGTAPLIEQFPVNYECKVEHILELGSHALVVGSVVECHVSEDCLTDGKPDVDKINTVVFSVPKRQYLALGRVVADAYSVGKELKTGE